MKRLTFAEFQATRNVMTLENYIKKYDEIDNYQDGNIERVLVYEGGTHIELMDDGKFYLLIERSDYLDFDLRQMEKLLYEWADGEVLQAINVVYYNDIVRAAGYNDLDKGLKILQDAIGQKYGDVAGIYFSGIAEHWEHFTVESRLLHLMEYLREEEKETSADKSDEIRLLPFEIRKLKNYKAIYNTNGNVFPDLDYRIETVSKIHRAYNFEEALEVAQRYANSFGLTNISLAEEG